MEIKEILSNKSTLIGFITCVLRSPKEFSVEQVLDIYMKRPSLEIRTYNGWKEIGRQVCLGEKGVGFYDPNSTLKNKQTYVFDVSQTKGHYRKKPEFTYEEFNKVFYQVNDISLIVSNHSIEEYKEEIAKKLEIKETKNATDRRIIIEESGESQQERRVDNRTIDGDRGISQEGVRTSIGERDDTIRTIEDTNQSIWVTSRSVSQIEQLYEVYGTSSEWSDGTRVDSDRGESDEVRRPDVLGVSTTEERNVSRESDAQSSVYSRSERESVQGNNSSVRDELSNYILTEEDFISRSPKERFKDNVEAIKVVKTLKKEDRLASIEEQKILSKYVGWGGLQEAFNASNASWSNEYKVLKELLTTDEYEFAQGSVLNAHFTSKEIIDGIYAGLRHLGVKKGKVLEPSCGTGNFIGCKPNDMEFSFDGVELDTITAQIAQALYPKESIKQSGFEDCKIKDGTYDIVIGNVPFGDYRVYDNDYNRYKFVIHDYFIAKSLDKLRAGGIMAIITGKGTLDKQNSSARRYFAERANLLGAFRLPNTAFKGNAGTEAVADILFFQKREENIPSAELAPQTIEWIRSGIVEENVPALNDYFVEHKENVLGEFKLVSGRFGMDRTVVPSSEELSKDLEKIIEFLPKDIYKEPSKIEEKKKEENSSIGVLNSEEMDSLGIKNYSMFLYNNRVYIRETDTFVLSERKILQGELSGKVLERVKGYIALREQVRKVIDIQCDNCSDDLLKQEQQELNSLYDNFVKKYGYLNEVVNDKYFREDLDYPLVCSVEDYDNEEKVGKKCAIFNTRTIKNVEKKTYVEDTHEALALCKNELGEVDLHYIEKLTKLFNVL